MFKTIKKLHSTFESHHVKKENDRYAYLRKKIKKSDPDHHISLVPQALFLLVLIKKHLSETESGEISSLVWPYPNL